MDAVVGVSNFCQPEGTSGILVFFSSLQEKKLIMKKRENRYLAILHCYFKIYPDHIKVRLFQLNNQG